VRRLESEFFAQGDRERELGLPVSFLMDRGKPGASETQGGFFDFVVLPLFGELVRAVPAAEPVLLAVKENHHYWMHPDARPECKTKHALQEGDATASEELEDAEGQPLMTKSRSSRLRQHACIIAPRS